MASKGRPIRLRGARTWIGEITQSLAKESAEEITKGLIQAGPWYSGEFAKNWAIEVGDKNIPADVEPRGRRETEDTRNSIVPVAPSLRGTGAKQVVGYSIMNRVTYRDIAMDLIPGRVKKESVDGEPINRISAPEDWYRKFVESGPMTDLLKESVNVVAQNPKIRGFSKETSIIVDLEL